VQGSDPRLGTPPLSYPPQTRHVHLGFVACYQAAACEVDAPGMRRRLGEGACGLSTATAASVLQALGALLVGDLRCALAGLRVGAPPAPPLNRAALRGGRPAGAAVESPPPSRRGGGAAAGGGGAAVRAP